MKGQLTIFVILGIVLFVAFTFLFFARATVVSLSANTQQKQAYADLIETSPIRYRIYSCLDAVTNEGVYWLGLQGGVLYDFQDGNTTFDPTGQGTQWLRYNASGTLGYEYDAAHVAYGLKEQLDSGCVYIGPPDYPYPHRYAISPLPTMYSGYQDWIALGFCSDVNLAGGPLGQNVLQKLCSPTGPNRYQVSADSTRTCWNILNGTPNVQEELAGYMQKQLKGCVNFSEYANISQHNITVVDNPNITITYGVDGFAIDVTYPFVVYIHGREPIVSFAKFSRQYPVRLKEMFQKITTIIGRDARSVLFNLSDIPGSYSGWPADYVVYRAMNVCTDPLCGVYYYDDIIQIIDTASLVKGKPFLFQFAVQDRPPVLDYLHNIAAGGFDIAIAENQTLIIDPRGYDPDEGVLTYNYSGWKETEDAYFNFTGCMADMTNCINDPSLYVVTVPFAPYNLSYSFWYVTTGRNASYVTNSSDTGLHFVTITVTKERGLQDWQNVSILVYDLPLATLNGMNNYSDLTGGKELWGSLEDVYILNGSGSRGSLLHNTSRVNFIWNDTTWPWGVIGVFEYQLVPDGLYDISSIRPLPFNQIGTHTMSLQINDTTGILSAPAYWDVDVKECLPHRNPSQSSYPYGSGSDFFRNHTCCTDVGTYAGSSVNCYGKSYWSCNPSTLCGSVFNEIPPAQLAIGVDPFDGTIIPATAITVPRVADPGECNDIYYRTYQQNCSDNRGNVCGGAVLDRWIKSVDCQSVLTASGDYCVGPCNPLDSHCHSPACQNTGFNEATYGHSCFNYSPGQTFKTNFITPPAVNGVCNTNWACSKDTSIIMNSGHYVGTSPGTYADTGGAWSNYSCRATCDGVGGCTFAYNCTRCIDTWGGVAHCIWNTDHYDYFGEYSACNPTDPSGPCTGTQLLQWPSCDPWWCCTASAGCYDECSATPYHEDCIVRDACFSPGCDYNWVSGSCGYDYTHGYMVMEGAALGGACSSVPGREGLCCNSTNYCCQNWHNGGSCYQY
ncbi:MAG: hypothetical protein V1725_06180 [archaeon]